MSSIISLLVSFLLLFTAINRFWIAFEILDKTATKHTTNFQYEYRLRKCGASIAFQKNIRAAAKYWQNLHSDLSDEITLASEQILNHSEQVNDTCHIGNFYTAYAHMQKAHGLPNIWPNWTFRIK